MAGPTGSLQTIATTAGFYYSEVTTEITEKHYGLVVTGDCVIGSWEDDEGNDLVAYFNISGKTITTDFPALIIPSGRSSSSITVSTNGGVCLLRA